MFSNEQMLLLVLFGALLHSWLGAMLRYVWRHRQTAPGFQFWAWSEGLLGMAYLVMLVFFLLPNHAILLASTLLLTLSPLAYEHGLRRFFDDARLLPAWGGYAIASAGLLLQAAAMRSRCGPCCGAWRCWPRCRAGACTTTSGNRCPGRWKRTTRWWGWWCC